MRPRWGVTGIAVVRAVMLSPTLWWTALGTVRRLARPGWWRRLPFLPVPDPDLWGFRLMTAYGEGPEALPSAKDVRSYLRWCRQTRPVQR